MGRTASTEPQCLYKGALYLYLFFIKAVMIQDNPMGKVMCYRLGDRNFIPRSVNIAKFEDAENPFVLEYEAI
jgi:hypothetical protein